MKVQVDNVYDPDEASYSLAYYDNILREVEKKYRKNSVETHKDEGVKAHYWAGFWQGLSIGLGVAFFGMLAEFIIIIN